MEEDYSSQKRTKARVLFHEAKREADEEYDHSYPRLEKHTKYGLIGGVLLASVGLADGVINSETNPHNQSKAVVEYQEAGLTHYDLTSSLERVAYHRVFSEDPSPSVSEVILRDSIRKLESEMESLSQSKDYKLYSSWTETPNNSSNNLSYSAFATIGFTGIYFIANLFRINRKRDKKNSEAWKKYTNTKKRIQEEENFE